MRKIWNTILKGLVAILPVGLTVYVIYAIARMAEGLFSAIMKLIATQKSARHAVLDSWNLVDFILRRNLVLMLGLQRFETPDFDPKYDLLPRSFEDLLKCIESFSKSQLALPKDPDPFDYVISFPTSLLMSLERSDPERSRWFFEHLEGYYRKECPVAWASLQKTPLLQERRPKNLSGQYREFIEGLDKDWFKTARRLNKARNLAAHVLDETSIAQAFGINGPDFRKKVREECRYLLKKLIGLKKPTKLFDPGISDA